NMSHELRTPLNAILGMSQLLEKSGLTEEQEDLLHSLKAGGDNLFRMISNILDLSQFEAGTKLGFFKEKVSLKHLAEQLEEDFTTTAKKRNLTFHVEFGELIQLDFATDKVKIIQVIGNLVDNAIKFSTSGKVTVSLFEEKEDLIFKVSDQGIGIDDEMKNNLFEAFSQKDISFAREFEGLGIGLALCRHLCELLGGKIWLTSKVGVGTEVFLAFPKKTIELSQADDPGAKKPEKKHLISPEFAKEYPMRILLAEDNLTNQKLAVKVLAKLGYEVAVANNGLEAVQAMENVDYDMILMDLQMPEMDGVEATKKILGEMKKPVKIIALTANAAAGVREECEAVGMVDFLNKPMNIMELTKKLAQHSPANS
ncbi:MAG: response regulator, partial [SAR324 cluster bacterium]|nr:response regulator [SAR324 cluster bacterium]